MNPGCSWNLRSIPDLAVSATSWKVPLVISYVATRQCSMIDLLLLSLVCVHYHLGPTRARSRANVARGIKPSLRTSSGDGIWWKRSRGFWTSPVYERGRVSHQYAQVGTALSRSLRNDALRSVTLGRLSGSPDNQVQANGAWCPYPLGPVSI